MFLKIYKDHIYFTFFDRLDIFTCRYRTTVKTEYWTGYRRKRICKIGNMTVWIRE